MIFGFTTNGDISEMIHSFGDNLGNPSKVISSRLFSGEIIRYDDDFYTCELNYLLPVPYWLFLLGAVTGFIFNINWLWKLGIIIFVLLYGMQTKYFYYFIMRLALKKKGYKEKIRLLSDSETIYRLKVWGANQWMSKKA